MKRLETFLTSPGQADPARQPLGEDRLLAQIQGQTLFHCSRAPRDLVTCSPRVNQNSLSNSVSKWPPWSNPCPEISTEQKTIKKPCGFCQGLQPAKRMDVGKVAEDCMVWGYIQYGGVREICRVEGNISSLKYQEV